MSLDGLFNGSFEGLFNGSLVLYFSASMSTTLKPLASYFAFTSTILKLTSFDWIFHISTTRTNSFDFCGVKLTSKFWNSADLAKSCFDHYSPEIFLTWSDLSLKNWFSIAEFWKMKIWWKLWKFLAKHWRSLKFIKKLNLWSFSI